VEEWLVKQPLTMPVFSQTPQLVLRTEGIYWRVPLQRLNGQAIQVGVVDVHVETGVLEVMSYELGVKNLTQNTLVDDVTQDPIFNMGSHDFEAPPDLSIDPDKYLYGEVETA